MKMNILSSLLIISFLFSSTLAACGPNTCGASSCCDDTMRGTMCFDPNMYTCSSDKFNGKTYLCGKGTQSCSGSCYDTTNYDCNSSGNVVQKGREPANTNPSTSTSSSKAVVTSSSTSTSSTASQPTQTTSVQTPAPSDPACKNQVCSGSQACCNGQCFETNQYQCVKDSFLSRNQLCPKGNFGSCNGGCFDSKTYHCENGQLAYGPAPTAASSPSNSKTVVPTSTVSSTVKVPTSTSSSTSKAATTAKETPTSTSSSTSKAATSTSSSTSIQATSATIIVNPVPVPSAPSSCGSQSCFYCCNSQCYDPLVYGCSNDNGKQYLCPAVKESKPSSFWMEGVVHNGMAAFNADPQGYKVFRNVKDFGAKGDGKTDDTEAINAAITAYGRCGQGCDSSTVKPALVYFPSGTYLISSPIIQYYFTQLVGNAINLPTLLAAPGFSGMAMIDSNPYSNTGNNWFTNQNNFYRQIRNFVLDTTLVSAASGATCIHWQVAQATSITNVVFKMSSANGNNHQGIWMENGSGGFMSDLVFYGGKFGMWVGNQQFTSRNLTFEGCQTAIYMNWNWGWTFKSLFVNKCEVGMDMSSSSTTGQLVGSVVILDAVFKNTKKGIITGTTQSTQPTTSGSLSLDNVNFVAVAQPVSTPSGANLISSSNGNAYVSSWGQGRYYGSGKNNQFAQGNSQSAPVKPAALLTSSGSFFEKPKPQYEKYSVSDFVNVKTLGALGDGKTDDTAALSAAFLKYAGCKIVFIPHGTYLVSDTILIPSGSRIVGEAWSQLMATGSKFQNANSPKVVFKVGNSGDVGTVEISDVLFTTNGPVPGAILVEWNIKDPVGQQGACGMWDTHFRFGGAKGTKLQVGNCKAGNAPTAECMVAFMMLHLTTSSSAYLENVWAWTADHDLDGDGQISIYNARGLLCESTAGVWMYGTAVEHNVLYQYNFIRAQNVFMAMIQTETPYYQGSPLAPAPVVSSAAYNDPDYSSCPSGSKSCAMSWGLRSVNSKSIFTYGAGLYAFFNNYSQKCLDDETCQDSMVQFQGTNSQIYFFGLNTKAAITMIQNNGVAQVPQIDNRNTFCSTIHYVLN